IHLDRNNETSAPLKPNTAQKASSELRFSPSAVIKRPTPSKFSVTPATASTAILVSKTNLCVTQHILCKIELRLRWVPRALNSMERLGNFRQRHSAGWRRLRRADAAASVPGRRPLEAYQVTVG